MGARACLLAAVSAIVGVASVSKAQSSVLGEAEVGAWLPLAPPQTERFGPGGHIGGGVLVPVTPWLAPSIRLRLGVLADGPAPTDASLRDPGVGGLANLSLGLRLRPDGIFAPEQPERARGLFIEIAAGVGVTGRLVRPVFDLAIGWYFGIDDVDLGPVLRFVHVVHFDDPLDDRSAQLLSFGLGGAFVESRPAPALESPEDPNTPPPDLPPGDRDGDTILDNYDDCPDEPEDLDGYSDEDGCPDPDNDSDGILDAADQCVTDPEDRDGVEDEDGCPEDDADADRIRDNLDTCPLVPETINGVDDADGCPDEGLFELQGDRIVLDERVLFDTDLARVRHAAFPVLRAVVELVRQHPEWTRIRVEGHADFRGAESRNLELSIRRARAVRTRLIEFGVEEPRLAPAEGFGETRPAVQATSDEALQANRRVEIVVEALSTEGRR